MNDNNLPYEMTPELLQSIKDLSAYFDHQKEMGLHSMKLSKETENILNGWEADKSFTGMMCQGSQDADIYIVDSSPLFFKREAGELLVKILKAMNLTPEQVFICHSDPSEAVQQKISLHQPKVVICFGASAAQTVLENPAPISEIRGKFHHFNGIPIMATLHPAFLLTRPQDKRLVWEDMKQVMELCGL